MKGRDLDKYFLGENGNKKRIWTASVHYLINAWLEKDGMLPNYASCGGRLTEKLGLVKMGIILESICMEGQGHIFTFDLIFLDQRAILRGPVFSE